jgi:uncharacterized membrane protein YjjB (DUF3815 family)
MLVGLMDPQRRGFIATGLLISTIGRMVYFLIVHHGISHIVLTAFFAVFSIWTGVALSHDELFPLVP